MPVSDDPGAAVPNRRARVVFMGTPELARRLLASLADDPRWDIVGVFAQPDRPAGRGLQPQAPPVKREADDRGFAVFQPGKMRDPLAVAALAGLAPDVAVVAAYGQILPPAVLAIPRAGCLNVHFSLLPRWRGAAPIAWALLEGDAETGVTLMQMDAGLDTGPMFATATHKLRPDETSGSLTDRLTELGAQLLRDNLGALLAGELAARPQPAEGATYARKLTRDDARLDWRQPAAALDRRVRAMAPTPGAFAFLPGSPNTRLVKIHSAEPAPGRPAGLEPGSVWRTDDDRFAVACGDGSLVLREVQLEGGKRLTAAQFFAGHAPLRFD